jgi:hypothetical protein
MKSFGSCLPQKARSHWATEFITQRKTKEDVKRQIERPRSQSSDGFRRAEMSCSGALINQFPFAALQAAMFGDVKIVSQCRSLLKQRNSTIVWATEKIHVHV